MTAHTPGPWIADMDEKGIMRVSALGFDANITAEVFGVREYDGEDAANALLIAAAPELYEALVAMVDRWEPDSAGADRRMYEAAVVALAKAEGR